jgi:hypothetical protein
MRDPLRRAPRVERAPARDAERRLRAVGGGVDAGVNDLAVAARNAAGDPGLRLEHEHRTPGPGHGRRRREPDDTGADDDDVEARVRRAAGQRLSPYSAR